MFIQALELYKVWLSLLGFESVCLSVCLSVSLCLSVTEALEMWIVHHRSLSTCRLTENGNRLVFVQLVGIVCVVSITAFMIRGYPLLHVTDTGDTDRQTAAD